MDIRDVSRSPTGWTPVADILAGDMPRGAKSGAPAYGDAPGLAGTGTLRAAEARNNLFRTGPLMIPPVRIRAEIGRRRAGSGGQGGRVPTRPVFSDPHPGLRR